MSKYNKLKAEALGMSYGAACGRLRKILLFNFVVGANQDNCYRCGKKILSVADLSIEHKEAWMQADDPLKSFFDLGNTAFSHLSCNAAAAVNPKKKYFTEAAKKSAKLKEWKTYWDRMGKEQQQERRRRNYAKYGC